jgi:hypothetical protein
MKNLLRITLTTILLLGLTSPALSVCKDGTGVEVVADGSVVRTKLPLLLTKLLKDATPQARLYAKAVAAGKGCQANHCVNVVVISRDSIEAPAQQAMVICKREMI